MDSRRNLRAQLALAALTGVAALSLRRVFDGSSFVGPVLGAALLPFLIGFASRRWHWPAPVAAVVSLLGLAAFAIGAMEASTTTFGLPTERTLHAFSDHMRDGWDVLRTGVAPVPAHTGTVLLALVATWVTAALADWLAFRLDATIGAVVPPLILFVISATLGTSDDRIIATALFAALAVAFLLFQHEDLLTRQRAWFSGQALGSASRTLVVGLLIGVLAIAFGALVGPRLPGASDSALIKYRHRGTRDDGTGAISLNDPLVNIASDFLRQAPRTVFTVQVTGGQRLYYRFVALDRFDGSRWTFEGDSQRASSTLASDPPVGTIRQHYHIADLTGAWIPAAYDAKSISLTNARVSTDFDALFVADGSITGKDYTVGSKVPTDPTPPQIAATGNSVPRAVAARYTKLPTNFPPSVRRQARTITHGATNRFQQATDLARFFTDPANGFHYDLNIQGGHGNDAMVEFLETKHGFCEQFAGTYAAMARSIGLPSRVAVGFTSGDPDPHDPTLFTVTNRHAHAWVEVWLSPKLGWVAFEPTPPGLDPGATPPAQNNTVGPPVSVPTASTTQPSATSGGLSSTAPLPNRTATPQPPSTTSSGISSTLLLAILIPLFAFGILAAYVLAIPKLKGRRAQRSRASTDTRDAVRGAWSTALDRLDTSGIPARPTMTPLEIASSLGRHGAGPLREPMQRLASSYSSAIYAPDAPSEQDAVEAWAYTDEIDELLRSEETVGRRWRRELDPRPLLTRR